MSLEEFVNAVRQENMFSMLKPKEAFARWSTEQHILCLPKRMLKKKT